MWPELRSLFQVRRLDQALLLPQTPGDSQEGKQRRGLALSSPQPQLLPRLRPGSLLHPAKLSAALGGQGNPGLLSLRCLIGSLVLTLALQLGWETLCAIPGPSLTLVPVQGEQQQQGPRAENVGSPPRVLHPQRVLGPPRRVTSAVVLSPPTPEPRPRPSPGPRRLLGCRVLCAWATWNAGPASAKIC